MPYQCVAMSVAGFVQQLAVNYVARGYCFYVTGTIPEGKDPAKTDRKIIEQYGIDISKWARARRRKEGKANIQIFVTTGSMSSSRRTARILSSAPKGNRFATSEKDHCGSWAMPSASDGHAMTVRCTSRCASSAKPFESFSVGSDDKLFTRPLTNFAWSFASFHSSHTRQSATSSASFYAR